jgi:uncharacterized membrane protein YidH (DUF202 family)
MPSIQDSNGQESSPFLDKFKPNTNFKFGGIADPEGKANGRTKRRGRFCGQRFHNGHLISSKTRLRVEPKTFFANERTLIQWITGALLLMTVAALLIDIDDNSSTRLIGFFLIVCGAFVVCYGVFVYFRRIHLMTTGSAYGYVDYLGPILLACCVLGSIGVLSYFIFHTALPPPEFTQPYLSAVPGLCEQYTFSELSYLEFQPSDVVVDSERNILLIPSLSTIVSVPIGQRTISVPEVLIDIPGADFEALTVVGDRLFAVSEGDKNSRLFELQWDFGRLTQVQEYLIPSERRKGLRLFQSLGKVPSSSFTSQEIRVERSGRLTCIVFPITPLLLEVPTSPQRWWSSSSDR